VRASVTTTIVTGLMSVVLEGYNLGNSIADLKYIRVGAETCTSVLFVSSHRIECTLVLRGAPSLLYSTVQYVPSAAAAGGVGGVGGGSGTGAGAAVAGGVDDGTLASSQYGSSYTTRITELTSETDLLSSIVPFSIGDVEIATIGGRTSGVSAKPLTTVRSESGRPTLSHIELALLPFSPYTIAVATHQPSVGTSTSTTAKMRTLYWANTAYGANCIQRSNIDGSQVETVINNVSNNI
jgi:hypothetical protein